MQPSQTFFGIFSAITLALATPAFAQDSYNRINFGVETKAEVINDEMLAVLVKTTQGKTAKDIAKTLNHTINQALIIAKKYPDVLVSTGRQSTYPNYADDVITGFTGSASLEISSQNFEQASQLIADLQSMMVIDRLGFGVSKQVQQATEKQLSLDAIRRFQDEAVTITHAFGAEDYKIVNVQLGNNNHYYARPMAMMSMAKSSNAIEAQTFESGKSTLSYQANGTIELTK